MQGQKITERIWLAALLMGITLLVYFPALGCEFIWDDDKYVTENETLRSMDGLWRMWTVPTSIPQYYPLVHTTYWVEYHLWGLHPRGYHLTNVLLHGFGAVLLWRVLVRLNLPGSWLAAAVFAVHPVQVESVAWVTERKNVLAGVFYFGALLAYLRWRPFALDRDSPQSMPRYYAISLVLFLFALLSKTVTATLPAAILVITWWKIGRIRWRDVLPLWPMFAVGIALGLHTAYLERHHVGTYISAEFNFSPLDRLLIAGRAVWFYAGKLLWPTPLMFTYPRWQIDPGLWWQYLFPATAIGVVVLFWLLRKRIGRGPLAAVLLFGGTLFPALGFVDVYPMRFSFVADHFQYLATPAMISLVIATAVTILSRDFVFTYSSTLSTMAATLLLIGLGTISWSQQAIYQDPLTLWTDTVTKNPSAWMAYHNRGAAYQRTRQPKLALADFNKAIDLKPDYAKALNNRGKVYHELGESSRALQDFDRVIRMGQKFGEPYIKRAFVFGDAYSNRGSVLMTLGKYDLALADYTKSIELKAEDGRVHNNIAWLMATCPDARYRDGAKAVFHASRACELSNWGEFTAFDTLAAAYAEDGRFDEAVRWQAKAIELAPKP